MALTSCFCHSSASFKVEPLRTSSKYWYFDGMTQSLAVSIKNSSSKLFGRQDLTIGTDLHGDWSFVGGSKVYFRRTKFEKFVPYQKRPAVHASWLPNSQIASSVFSLGTITVLPFYTLMVLAPKAELTKKSIESNIPYVVLGLLYAYLLYLSWTPETVRLIFASKYWLPELPGIAKMFSSEMTLASAWIHLLVVDLFAARQIFHDGQQNKIETRHSVSFCLLFCPIGILIHVLTKALKRLSNKQTM